MREILLELKNLKVDFPGKNKKIRAVDGINLIVHKGENLCIVGESGSGKTVTGLSLMRLIDEPGRIAAGSEILFEGKDILKYSEKEMDRIRGSEIAMIFQEPMSALNPVMNIGDQIAETVRLHENVTKRKAIEKALEILKLVGMPDPEVRLKNYPHQMSGGMRQRVVIAMAIVCKPKLLIADEPTTALDVTVQAQIIELLDKLRITLGMAILHITHDLGLVAETADRVAVAYGGKIVESGVTEEIFSSPRHPYTRALLKSIPTLGSTYHHPLHVIKGMVPADANWPSGCRFRERCPDAIAACLEYPSELTSANGHMVACWKSLPEMFINGEKNG